MLNLRITEEQFKTIYGVEEIPDIFYREPEDMDDLWANFMPSKLWRLNNLYTISDKEGNEVRFRMNWAQHKVYSASLRHPRLIILKSRQQGISTLWLVSFFDDAITNDLYEIGLMTQGQSESMTLFRRVKRLWDRLPDFVKSGLGLRLTKDSSKEIGFSNESMMYIATSFRSGTLHRLHISEMGKISAKYPEKARETKTGTLQAIKSGNTVVIESTAEGRKNMFYEMWYTAVRHKGIRSGKDFMPVFLSWVDDPDCAIDVPQAIDTEAEEYFSKLEHNLSKERCVEVRLSKQQKWWWVAQRRELGDDMGQEYPGTPDEAFASVRDGTYYSRLFRKLVEERGRVITNNKELADESDYLVYQPKLSKNVRHGALYDPALGVEVAMDLGMNDTMVLVFFQRYGREIRLIDEYHNNGEGLSHYVSVMKDSGYHIVKVWVPHDAKVRELGSGRSRLHRLKELGVKARVLPKTDVLTGIEQVRKMLEWVFVDYDKCRYLIDAFYNYSKQWDDRLEAWKDKPLHDEWSNPADAIRYVAMSKGSGKVFDDGSDKVSRRSRVRSNVRSGLAL